MTHIDYSSLQDELDKIRPQLRHYQQECVKFTRRHSRCIIDSRMGTGKTLMGLLSMIQLEPRKVLIICSKNALYTWQKEIAKWFPALSRKELYTVVDSSPAGRAELWSAQSLFYVCTYQTLLRDVEYAKRLRPDVLICDECHRGGLRNRKSKGFQAIKVLSHVVPNIFMLSGTVVSKGPQELWSMLNILDHRLFSSYWKFVNTFCIVIDGVFGKEIVGVQNTDGLKTMTGNYIFRVPKEIADKELPPITRELVSIDMTKAQAKHYKELNKKMYTELESGELVVASTIISKLIELRQILACPKILGVEDPGAGIPTIMDMLEDREDFHAVIFTPFRNAVTYLREYISAKYPQVKVRQLWGGAKPDEVREAVEGFKRERGLMLCTIKFAQSFDLETASVCFFLGYEWDQNENHQAEGRLRRMISSGPITAYYLKHNKTIDEDILEVLSDKTRNVRDMYQDIDKLRNLLKPK